MRVIRMEGYSFAQRHKRIVLLQQWIPPLLFFIAKFQKLLIIILKRMG